MFFKSKSNIHIWKCIVGCISNSAGLIIIIRECPLKSIHVGFSSQGQIIKFFGSVIMFCE
jgi:hypothetical protein